MRWQADGDFVQISVYHPDKVVDGATGILSLNIVESPVEPRFDSGPVLSGDGTSAMAAVGHGVVVKVTVSATLKDERDRILGGLHVDGA